MMQQAYDVTSRADNERYSALGATLSFYDNFENTDDTPTKDPMTYSPPKCPTLLDLDVFDELVSDYQDSCATPVLTPLHQTVEQLFLEQQLDDWELPDAFKAPLNEVTVTTTSDAENAQNTNIDNTVLDGLDTIIASLVVQLSLQQIDDSIEQRNMSVKVQPPVDLRPRYKSDGTRQIEKSRTKPMVVKLPDLKNIRLKSNQTFLLRLSLIKYNPDSSASKFLHVNQFEYHSEDVQKLSDGTPCVPVTTDEINEGEKALPRSAIVRRKLNTYESQLTPYCLIGDSNELHEDTNENEIITTKAAKAIYKRYNMQASRIACQLLIKEDQIIHFTNITCETHLISEKDRKKRSANAMDSDDESFDEPPSRLKSSASKRTRR